MTNPMSGHDRAQLCNELYDDLMDTIHEHGFMSTLTVAEVVGTLEILKFEIIDMSGQPEEGADE